MGDVLPLVGLAIVGWTLSVVGVLALVDRHTKRQDRALGRMETLANECKEIVRPADKPR